MTAFEDLAFRVFVETDLEAKGALFASFQAKKLRIQMAASMFLALANDKDAGVILLAEAAAGLREDSTGAQMAHADQLRKTMATAYSLADLLIALEPKIETPKGEA